MIKWMIFLTKILILLTQLAEASDNLASRLPVKNNRSKIRANYLKGQKIQLVLVKSQTRQVLLGMQEKAVFIMHKVFKRKMECKLQNK